MLSIATPIFCIYIFFFLWTTQSHSIYFQVSTLSYIVIIFWYKYFFFCWKKKTSVLWVWINCKKYISKNEWKKNIYYDEMTKKNIFLSKNIPFFYPSIHFFIYFFLTIHSQILLPKQPILLSSSDIPNHHPFLR